jgi:hypothetical protein
MLRPMLEDLSTIDWAMLPQPPANTERTVPEAIRCLATTTAASSQDAYHRLLYAIGNNHAGTYYPVALAVVPFLAEILKSGSALPRARTLDVLIDLVGSFEPEPPHGTVETELGSRPLASMLRDAVATLTPVVEGLASAAASEEEADLAEQVLALFRE